jgi:hypothetical protein
MKARLFPQDRTLIEGALKALLSMIGDRMVSFRHHVCRACGAYRKQEDVTCGLCPECVRRVSDLLAPAPARKAKP